MSRILTSPYLEVTIGVRVAALWVFSCFFVLSFQMPYFLFESSARVQGQCSQVNVNTNVHILNILLSF